MKLLSAITIILISIVLGATSAQSSFYIGTNGGVSIAPDSDVTSDGFKATLSWDTGYLVSAVVGYGLNNLPIRIEGEVFYQENDIDALEMDGEHADYLGNHSFENSGLLINAYYDFVNSSDFIPFISAGVGYSEVKMSGDDAFKAGSDANGVQTVDDTGFAWQIGAGVAYKINEQLYIDLKYRYYQSDGFTFTNQDYEFDGSLTDKATTDFDYSVHNILFGIRYSF